MPQRHPQPADTELHEIMRPIERVVAELNRLRVARQELRQNNAALVERNNALVAQNAALQPVEPAEGTPAPVDGWEAYSAGVQCGYDHQTAGTQPNWFAVRGDYDSWVEQTQP